MMEDLARAEAEECARRCLEAKSGRDEETQRALERAAGKFALRALGLVGEEASCQAPPRCLVGGQARRAVSCREVARFR